MFQKTDMSTIKCEPCGKSFTGPPCFNQHLESEKHKRKILSLKILNNSSGTIQPANTVTQMSQLNAFECSVCELVFNSVTDFQTHSLSSDHAQKVIEKNSKNTQSCCDVSSSNSSLNYKTGNTDENSKMQIFDEKNDNILPVSEFCKSQTSSFAFCKFCNKNFSGPEPYKQHIESVPHKKKVELGKNAVANNTNQIISLFSCDPCKKTFSGQIPYDQHMNSEVHKKKILGLQYLEKSASEVNSITEVKVENNFEEKNQNNPWFCKNCQIQCNGITPYKQHLEGIAHLKKTLKAQTEKNSFQPENTVQSVLQISGNEKIIVLNEPHLVNGTNQLLQKSDKSMEVDSVLPGITDKLNIISTEELQESITTFLPDDNIDFDQLDNKINTNSADKKINCVSKEVQNESNEESMVIQDCDKNNISDVSKDIQIDEMEEKSNAFKVCVICNVKLLNKEDAINHYESLEHFNRRWK